VVIQLAKQTEFWRADAQTVNLKITIETMRKDHL